MLETVMILSAAFLTMFGWSDERQYMLYLVASTVHPRRIPAASPPHPRRGVAVGNHPPGIPTVNHR